MLHTHSTYSIIDGRGTIKDYLLQVVEDKQTFFALTDHGSIGGAIDLYKQAKALDINPVLGCELYVDAVELRERNYPGHLTVLAKNEAGYRALIAVNNLAHRQFYYRPRVTIRQLIDGGYLANWVVLSGCMSSPVHYSSYPEAEILVRELNKHAGSFFLEVMWHRSEDPEFGPKQDSYLERVAALHKSTGIPLALTNDCHYANKDHEDIHQALVRRTHSQNELEFDGSGFHFKTLAQMQGIADGLGCPDSLGNSIDAGNSCHLVIPEADKVNWYVPDVANGRPKEVIMAICDERLRAMNLGQEYKDRYALELSVLSTSPAIINSYLVANDVVNWCAERRYPVAARGSMAGSLVSYLLGITQEDPVKYRLSFNRAVNPARPTIPDFDLDVSSIHRGEILDYLAQRYVGNIPICSYTHYGPKGAMRKILRMENLRDQDSVNLITKELPDDWKEGDFEYSARRHKKIIAEWKNKVPEEYHDPLAIYDGVFSNISAHPSGILISGPERELEDQVPLQYIASSKVLASAYDMYTLKNLGLYKLDILGLKTLDQLDYMEKVSGTKVPDDDYNDPAVLKAFGNYRKEGFLAEIFQMDGYACREVIRSINGIESFEDIIAANTLARPGCAQFTQVYRSGYENLIREYPPVSEILHPTNGLILYQEQTMEIARVLADFTDAEQDDVKEAIKYFKHAVWTQTIEPLMRQRMIANGHDPKNMLDAIARMASYTYNRAHAMTYAAIAYKMMWYKMYHSAAFYAAVFDAAGDKSRLVLESHFFGVKWKLADINTSLARTTVNGNEISLGLASIKGVASKAYETIAANRPYTSLEDFIQRVERKKCNVRVVTTLRDAYAMGSLGIPGSPASFEEFFGFPISILDSDLSKDLYEWQSQFPSNRLAGFVTGLRSSRINRLGPNHGKEMGRAKIVNISGGKTVVMFPDVWKKAVKLIYNGAAVKLYGNHQVEGDFIVEGGEKA